MAEMNQKLDLSQSDKYCVFQCGPEYFAVPALSVRRVVPQPPVSAIPFSSPELAGMSYTQQEFLPVFDFSKIINATQASNQSSDPDGTHNQLMVLNHDSGSWSLLVDRMLTLTTLEVAIGPQNQSSQAQSNIHNKFVSGSASFDQYHVRIIDVENLFESLDRRMHEFWLDSNPNGSLS